MSNHFPEPMHKAPPPVHSHRWKIAFVLIVLAAIGIWGIGSRLEAASRLHKQTNDEAIPTVAVITAPSSPAEEEVVLPGNVQAWHEAPIYARTNGYLKNWTSDIGARVKAGDVLAQIETPEIDAQLHQAEADLSTAEANNSLAQSTAQRWMALLKTNSVSKQETDEKIGDATAKEALVASARANLDRLHQLESFKRVTAPFDGTITARNTDTGALINAGSDGTGKELFHIAKTDLLRVYIQVPENYTQAITPDMKADLHFTEYPQRSFTATLVHTADAIDPVTRTLLVQLEVDNSDGALLSGSYAEVHLKVPSGAGSVHLPVNTLLFRTQGLQVATVTDGKARLKTITIGRDYGKEVEVTSGVTAGEAIIVNPPDSIADGQDVRVASPDQKQEDAPKGDGNKEDDKKKSDGDGKKP